MSIAVKDTGTALVAAKVMSFDGETVESQLIGLIDGTTPTFQMGVTSTGRGKVEDLFANTITSASVVGVTASATLIIAANSSRVQVRLQNYTDGATNSTIFIGGSTVSTATGIALLDGDTMVFKNRGAVYGIIASGTANIRILEETAT